MNIEQYVERVTNGLLVKTEFDGTYKTARLEERMQYYNTPGVSIAVVENFEIIWARVFGVKKAGEDAPVTDTTLFQFGSISKAIFATAVMKLV